jgi:glycosyltransferase EpsH
MDEVKVSVIVPVYNAQDHLAQCIDSILSQTLKEIEIICVDDGSSDASVEILEEYARNDSRLTLLKQNHKYAGTARNYGKSIARGEYLVFWDADDYFMPDALEEMYRQCVKDAADVCICSGRQYFEDGEFEAPSGRYLRKKEIPEIIPFNAKTAPDHIVSITVEAPWNKMFRREYIEDLQLDFQPVRNANDVFFVICALCMAQRVTIVNRQLVCYRKNKATGLVATVQKNLKTAFTAWTDTADYLRAHDAFPERSFANRALESVIYLLCNVSGYDAYLEAFEYLRENRTLDRLSVFDEVADDYYYVDYHKDAANLLRNGTPEAFAQFMWRIFYLKEGAAASKLRKKNEDSKAQSAKQKQEITRLKEQTASLKADKASLKETIDSDRTKITALKEDKEKLKHDLNQLKAQVKALKDEIKVITESVSFKTGRAMTWLPRKLRDQTKD